MSKNETLITQYEEGDVVAIFRDNAGQVTKVIDQIRGALAEFMPDITTASGRKEIASMAYKVSQSKTLMERAADMAAKEHKDALAVITGAKKIIKTECDAMRDETRAPLTAWEDEQARLQAEREKVTAQIVAARAVSWFELSEETIQRALDSISGIEIDPELFVGVMYEPAVADKADAISHVQGCLYKRKDHDEEQARLQAERIEAERQAEQARAETEAARLAAEEANAKAQEAEAARVAAEEKAAADLVAAEEKASAERQAIVDDARRIQQEAEEATRKEREDAEAEAHLRREEAEHRHVHEMAEMQRKLDDAEALANKPAIEEQPDTAPLADAMDEAPHHTNEPETSPTVETGPCSVENEGNHDNAAQDDDEERQQSPVDLIISDLVDTNLVYPLVAANLAVLIMDGNVPSLTFTGRVSSVGLDS